MASSAGAGGTPPAANNWLSEWSARTPVVCRYGIFVTLAVTLVSWIAGLDGLMGCIPFQVLLRGQVWRLLTAIPDQGSILTTLFVVLAFAVQIPPMEVKRGSLPMLLHVLVTGVFINVVYCAMALALSAIPWAPLRLFAITPSLGLWPVLLATMTEELLLDPTGSTPFLCFRIPNRLYGWALWAIFSLFSFFPLLDLLLGVIVGHGYSYGVLRFLRPSARRIEAWETSQGSLFTRIGFTRAMGYCYAPTSTPPVGSADPNREAMSQFWSAFSLGGALQRARGGAGAAGGQQQQQGGNGGDEEQGGGGIRAGSVIRYGNRAAPSAPSGSGAGGGAAQSSFGGAGHTLGGSVPAPSAPAAGGGGGMLGGFFGGHSAAGSAQHTGTATATAGHGGSGMSAQDAEARRRAMAAAAEARLRAQAGSNRPSQQQAASPQTASAPGGAAAAPSSGSGGFAAGAENPLAEVVAAASAGQRKPPPQGGRPHTVVERQPLLGSNGDSAAVDDEDLLGLGEQQPQQQQQAATAPATSTASAPGGAGAASGDTNVAFLIEMGFPEASARTALARTNGDLEAALELLEAAV